MPIQGPLSIDTSDGHVGWLWNFLKYSEYTPERIEIVKRIAQQSGDVRWFHFRDEGKLAGLRFPHVLGRVMIKLGLPTGDRGLQNLGLPDFILNGPPEVMCAYLREAIPQDGMVVIGKTQNMAIGRNVVLYDPIKAERYGFQQKTSADLVELVKAYGRPKKGVIPARVLVAGKLRRMAESKCTSISGPASLLLRIALENPVPLLADEHRIVVKLGFRCRRPSLQGVAWCEKTGRVSATWRLGVYDQVSVARWGLIACPNDIRKHDKLVAWMLQRTDRVQEAYGLLRVEGLLALCNDLAVENGLLAQHSDC